MVKEGLDVFTEWKHQGNEYRYMYGRGSGSANLMGNVRLELGEGNVTIPQLNTLVYTRKDGPSQCRVQHYL
jgi:hypothetical protein